MKIERVSTSLYRIPPSGRWEDAAVTVQYLEFVLVDLQVSGGLTGMGLAYTVGAGGSAVKALLDDYCIPLILGRDPHDSEHIWNLLAHALHRLGPGGLNTFAIAALDIAIWDAVAKSRGLQLHRALGSCRDSVPTYASGIDLFMSPPELHEHVSAFRSAGFRSVKIKVGCATARADIDRVAAARDALGPDGQLLLDANQGWSLHEAARRIRMFEEYDPLWIEEPLHPEDIEGHAELRRVTRVPVAVGESLYTNHQFAAYLRASAADILQPDVVRVGGITGWLKIARLCEAWHKPVAPHFMSEISVHVVCAVPNALLLEHVTGGTLHDLGIAAQLPIECGVARPPDAAGHGIVFDFDNLAQFEQSSSQAVFLE